MLSAVGLSNLKVNMMARSMPLRAGQSQLPLAQESKLKFQGLPSLHKPYLGKSVRFSGIMDDDFGVEFRDAEVYAGTVTTLQRDLLKHHWIKSAKGDNSSLKLFLNPSYGGGYGDIDNAAMADSFALINRPVDVIVKTYMGPFALDTLLSATGKRFMYKGAELLLGPREAGSHYGRNDDQQIERGFLNKYIRDTEYLLTSVAGAPSREQAYQDLNSSKILNSLQCLGYGSKGLIDAILVGSDQVVTREDLDQYCQAHQLSGPAREAFVRDMRNLSKLKPHSLRTYYEAAVPKGGEPKPSWYEPVEDFDDFELDEADDTKGKSGDSKSKRRKKHHEGLTFYEDGMQRDLPKSPPNEQVSYMDAMGAGRFSVKGLPDSADLLSDDAIWFNDAFYDETARQMTEALRALDEKKKQQHRDGATPSHIKLVVNSPGGYISSGKEIHDTINAIKGHNLVDVVVNGMAASCGAFLLASATGNRLATPNARVMIHDAWSEYPLIPNQHFNELQDSLSDSTHDFVRVIAHAAGRDEKQVWEDMKHDVWMNPLEAMFYGNKGLINAILVGQNKVITKDDVLRYLTQTLGSEHAVHDYIAQHVKGMRTGETSWQPADHDENDPFANSLKTIQAVAAMSSHSVAEEAGVPPGLKPVPGQLVDQYLVTTPMSGLMKLFLGKGEAQSHRPGNLFWSIRGYQPKQPRPKNQA